MAEAEGAPIRLLLVEDYPATREGLAVLLNLQPDLAVVGEAGSLAEARAVLAAGVGVDVALVDLSLPDGDGAELIRELRRRNPEAIALVLTGSPARLDHARAVAAGASYVLHKTTPTRQIADAIRRLCAGEVLMSPAEVAALIRLLDEEQERTRRGAAAVAQLTPRERAIVGLLAEGLGDKAIGARLGISARTVSNHMTALLDKLGVDSRLQVLAFAVRHGLVRIP